LDRTRHAAQQRRSRTSCSSSRKKPNDCHLKDEKRIN
jgi:hypothetical protein